MSDVAKALAVISVVVPVRNGMPWLEEQLGALVQQECSEPWELVVVDNESTDDSRSVVQAWAARTPNMRLIDARGVRGAAATRNAGVGAARGEVLAFCDADDVVQPGWLHGLVVALNDADFAGGAYDIWSLNGLPTPPSSEPSLPSAESQFGFLPAITSGNLALPRRVFEEIGGFAEDLMTGEDVDLSWRLQLRGYRFAVNPGAVVARRDQSGFWSVFRRNASYGRCGPHLYRRYRSEGLRSNSMLAAKTWVWLVLTTPGLIRPGFRARWAAIAGWRTGRLVESLRQRTFFL